MKYTHSAYFSDKIELTLRDIIKLLLGHTLKEGAMEIRLGGKYE